METTGALFDKLCTVLMKLWAVQDVVHKAAAMGEGLDADTVQKLAALNLERNELIREVDESIDLSIQAGKARVEPRIKIL